MLYQFNKQEEEIYRIILNDLKSYRRDSFIPAYIGGERLLELVKYAVSSSGNEIIDPCSIGYVNYIGKIQIKFQSLFQDFGIRKDFEKRLQYIISGIESVARHPYYKAKAAYLYLLNTVRYSDEDGDVNHSAWGAIMNGRAVCEGISYAYAFILSRLGIQCITVFGESKTRGNHSWNIVQLDGHCYHVDITWGIISGNGLLNYDYFMLTDGEIKSDHLWDASYIPECNSYQYNYFVVNGSYATTVKQVEKIIRKQIDNKEKEIYLKMDDKTAAAYSEAQLVDFATNAICQYSACFNGVRQYTYRYDKNLHILHMRY